MTLKNTIKIVVPRLDYNYVLNPSAEDITSNVAGVGGGTVTFSINTQKYGLRSYILETSADNAGMTLTLSGFPSDFPAYVSMLIARTPPPAWDVSLDNSHYFEPRFLEKIDEEWSRYGVGIPADYATGSTTLYIRQKGGGQGNFDIDGVHVGYYEGSTYIDGSQEGCAWLGAPHASASERSGDSRAGGVVKDFWEGYGFVPEKILEGGTAVENLNIDSYAFLPGGELNSSKIPPREFSITGFFLGNSKEELHEKVQALELELGLNTYPGQQPVRLRYSGARVQKEISANYAGGLEGDLPIYYNDNWSIEDEKWVRNYKFKMRASIQFIAIDPFWYEIGESVTTLVTNDSATFRNVAARLRSTGQWSNLGPPGTGGSASYSLINALAEDDTYIYMAGDPLNFDGIANADGIVRYNKQTGAYSAMGTGTAGTINAMVIGPNGYVYVTGLFASIGGVANTLNIAYWDGSAWNAMGTGLNDEGVALAVGLDGKIYAGGLFTSAGGVANTPGIAYWSGSAWVAMSTGMTGGTGVYAIAVSPITGYVTIGGSFTVVGGQPADNIALWNGSAWSVYAEEPDDIIHALAYSSSGILYAGGEFSSPGDAIALWNGSAWEEMGAGLAGGIVQVITIAPDGTVWVGGGFTSSGTLSIQGRMARWNGSSWSNVDVNLGLISVFAILASKPDPINPRVYNVWTGSGVIGTGTYAGSATASNGGTISAFPKIILARSGGTSAAIRTLRNERTGRELLFNYSLLNGETLTIDLNPKARSITSSFFGPRMDAILANSDFSVWQLLPGSNQVTAFVSETGSPTITAYLLYRDTYRSYN